MGTQSKLTEHLADALDLDDDAVTRAQRRAGERGGDVASQLLLMDVVDEEDLIDALADHYELSGADPDEYGRVDKQAFDMVSVDAMRQHDLIPFRSHERGLAVWVVAALDDEVVERLSEELEVSISQFVWPLVRHREGLHTLLGEPLADWARAFIARTDYSVGFDRSNRSDNQSARKVSRPVSPRDFGRGWTHEQTVDFIGACFDRDALLYTLLGYAERWFEDRLMVVITEGSFQPYMLVGFDEIPEEFDALERLRQVKAHAPADADLFDDENAGRALTGDPESLGLGALWNDLSLRHDQPAVVQTVRIGSRTSMALIGRGQPEDAPETFDKLEEVAAAVGTQLQEIIVRLANADGLPPVDERIPDIPASTTTSEPPADSSQPEEMAVPGQFQEDSASTDEDDDAGPGATAFGIPFADEADGEISDASRRGIAQDSSVSIMTPVDVSETSDAATKEPAAEKADASHGESQPQETYRGGFSVTEFESQLDALESSSAPKPGDGAASSGAVESSAAVQSSAASESSSTSEASAQPEVSDAPQKTGPDLDEALSSGLDGASKKKSDREPKKSAPMAQILRPVSLKNKHKDKAQKADGKADSSGTVGDEDDGGDPDELGALAEALDAPDPDEAFSAADRLAAFGADALEVLEEAFPGRPHLDRYQYTVDTMPPIAEHTPVMRALVALGDEAVPVAKNFLEDTSVELRFYATALFTELPPEEAGDAFIERLFDRDQQTRQVAKSIVLERLESAWFEETLVPRLREEIEPPYEDRRLEVAAELLGGARDAKAVEPLIESLEACAGRVQKRVHGALEAITYKGFVPSAAEWKNWWKDAQHESRRDWIVEALNSDLLEIREKVAEELTEFDGLDLDYHPDQPPKLRGRAQDQLEAWFDEKA